MSGTENGEDSAVGETTVIDWGVVLGGTIVVALTILRTRYEFQHQRDLNKRTQWLQVILLAIVVSIFVSMCVMQLLHVANSVEVTLVLIMARALGVGVLLTGIGLPWLAYRTESVRTRSVQDRYRGAPLLPTYLTVLRVTWAAASLFFASLGTVIVIGTYPYSGLLIVVAVICGVSCLVMMSTLLLTGVIGQRLQSTAQGEERG